MFFQTSNELKVIIFTNNNEVYFNPNSLIKRLDSLNVISMIWPSIFHNMNYLELKEEICVFLIF